MELRLLRRKTLLPADWPMTAVCLEGAWLAASVPEQPCVQLCRLLDLILAYPDAEMELASLKVLVIHDWLLKTKLLVSKLRRQRVPRTHAGTDPHGVAQVAKVVVEVVLASCPILASEARLGQRRTSALAGESHEVPATPNFQSAEGPRWCNTMAPFCLHHANASLSFPRRTES